MDSQHRFKLQYAPCSPSMKPFGTWWGSLAGERPYLLACLSRGKTVKIYPHCDNNCFTIFVHWLWRTRREQPTRKGQHPTVSTPSVIHRGHHYLYHSPCMPAAAGALTSRARIVVVQQQQAGRDSTSGDQCTPRQSQPVGVLVHPHPQ